MPPITQKNDLLVRTLMNGTAACVVFLLIFYAQHPVWSYFFTAAVALLAGGALWEYYHLVKKKGGNPLVYAGVGAGVLYVWSLFAQRALPHSLLAFLPQGVIGGLFFVSFARYAWPGNNPLNNIATTFFGFFYIAIPLGFFVAITYFFRDHPIEGNWWTFFALGVTKSSDLGGYFIGRYFGQHKLATRLSPNKTLEGAIAGLVAALAVSLGILFLGKTWGGVFSLISYPKALLLGLIVALAGQIGDLAESLLKRDAHTKDSGAIPGIGGILDTVDSLLFSVPVVYIFLKIAYSAT